MNRRPDAFGVALALLLVAALTGGGFALVACHVLTLIEVVGGVAAGVVLIAGHQTRPASKTFENTFAHGDARLSSEDETHAASGGANRIAELHDQTFSD